MCIPNVARITVQGLPQEDIQALRQFATGRHAKATTDHAKEFWHGLILAALPEAEYQRYLDNTITAESIPVGDLCTDVIRSEDTCTAKVDQVGAPKLRSTPEGLFLGETKLEK